jgi:hypothetical protein
VTPLARCPRRSARREPAHSEFTRCPAWRRRPPRPR